MTPEDTKQFFALLDQSCEVLGRPHKSNEAKAMFLELVGHHGIKNLRGAILAHLNDPERGRFPPSPADIKEQIAKAMEKDGRPNADEAWSIAIQLADENATVVSTPEISQAWAVAREIMPDRTGARMAFRSAYERLVAESRNQGQAVSWFPSLGFDVAGRAGPLEQAVEQGKLTFDRVKYLLPEPEAISPPMLRLVNSLNSGTAREELSKLKKLLKS